jgi:photosystem II stability/assembly factor-like uncharacterized protein
MSMYPFLRTLFGFEFRQAQCDRLRHCLKPQVERLEDRLSPAVWRPIGPAPILSGSYPVSGRVNAVVADPTDANTIYIAAAGGGVWKTNDGGTTWTPLTDNQSTLFMGSLALAPGNDINHRILYAGTGEVDEGQYDFYGRGILVSSDSGLTWTLTGSTVFNRSAIGKIIIDPSDATDNTAYAAVSGIPTNGLHSGLTGNYGIWKTTNGGTSWSNTTADTVDPTGQNLFTDLVMDPGNHNVLYAAVDTSFGVSANGVYETSNGGASWTRLSSFPGGTGAGRISLAIAAVGTSSTIYASVANPRTNATLEIEKSTDAGVTWKAVMTESSPNYINYMGRQGEYDQTLIIDPRDATGNTVYAAGQGSVIKTMNGGTSWTDISVGANGHGPHADHHGVGFDANGRLLDGNDGGIWRLDNPNAGSILWTDLNGNMQITQFYAIALHPANPNIAFGGSQDNGTDEYGGSMSWNQVYGGDGFVVRLDPHNPMRVYTESNFGLTLVRSDDGGRTFTSKASGIQGRFYDGVRYVLDPVNTNRVILGTDYVNQSLDNGDTWTAIGTPGPGFNPGEGTITAIATRDSTVYAAMTDGNVWVTTNNGNTWTKTDPIPGFLPQFGGYPGLFQDVEIDPDDSSGQTAYLVAAEFSEDLDRTGLSQDHVFRTTNAGASWTDISGNLPNLPANAIALGSGALYVGTDDGVYFSTDLGANWSRLGDGLPHAQVRELVLNASLEILAAGTYGRGLWELSLGNVATHFSVVSSLSTIQAGTPFSVTVTALDALNNPVLEYMGTVHFQSIGGATLPGDYTFTANDLGTHTFDGVVLTQAGSQAGVDQVNLPQPWTGGAININGRVDYRDVPGAQEMSDQPVSLSLEAIHEDLAAVAAWAIHGQD